MKSCATHRTFHACEHIVVTGNDIGGDFDTLGGATLSANYGVISCSVAAMRGISSGGVHRQSFGLGLPGTRCADTAAGGNHRGQYRWPLPRRDGSRCGGCSATINRTAKRTASYYQPYPLYRWTNLDLLSGNHVTAVFGGLPAQPTIFPPER